MNLTVSISAPGHMGAGVGKRLHEGGARVLTSLEGRSAASAERARQAGMTAVSDAELADADIILSILPPGQAPAFARRLAPLLRDARRKPVFVDCNAVSPETVMEIAGVIQEAGIPFLDGSIIGLPPKPGGKGPLFYISGPDAEAAHSLSDAGLLVRAIGPRIGSASALKMCYGGITKGLTALASAMALAADRHDVGDAFREELLRSQPALMPWLGRMVPDMFPKAYRWVAEMDEISDFLGERSESGMFHAIARTYERFADDWEGERRETNVLAATFGGQEPSARERP